MCAAGTERLRLVADTDAGSLGARRCGWSRQRRWRCRGVLVGGQQASASHQETDECVHGLGAGSAAQTGRPVPATTQRRAQQDARKTLEVCVRRVKIFNTHLYFAII